ncbi:hypothetical protein FQN54_009682 [Arachnomyces sp. PD_36]|nr:hypothetical protein FQN54_009682 [Arachnomyces sp. PD_36]
MGDHTFFFYGTLMASPVLYRVCHGTSKPGPWQRDRLTIRPAVLHNFRRHRALRRDYPAIVPVDEGEGAGSDKDKGSVTTTTSSVRGTLVSGLTDADIWRLDFFEGDEYEQRNVKVRVLEKKEEGEGGGGQVDGVVVTEWDRLRAEILEAKETEEEVEAVTYVWVADRGILEDEEWDFESFLSDKLTLWAG